MEGVLGDKVRELKHLSSEGIVEALKNDSPALKLTKSLLNILFNICFTKAVPLSLTQGSAFKAFDKVVLRLLSRTETTKARPLLLAQNPQLVRLISEACLPAEAKPGPS